MEDIKELLNGEIKTEIEKLNFMESGTEEKSKVVDDIVKLYKLSIDDTKNEAEDKKLKEERINRYFNLGLGVAGLILPMIFYGVWMKRGFKFEETGTYTSGTFKNLINKFKPTR